MGNLQQSNPAQEASRLTPLRCELVSWFHTNAGPLAAAYEGAIRLVDDDGFPGRIFFIAHTIRDISDRLVYVLDPQLEGTRVQYENELDLIEKDWPQLISVGDKNDAASETGTVRIDQKVASMIDSLVQAHRKRRQRPSNYKLLFRFLMRKEPMQPAENERLVKDFKKMRDWFMNRAHLRRSGASPIDESELHTQFGKFEGMLHSFVGSFFTGTKELDEILRKANQ